MRWEYNFFVYGYMCTMKLWETIERNRLLGAVLNFLHNTYIETSYKHIKVFDSNDEMQIKCPQSAFKKNCDQTKQITITIIIMLIIFFLLFIHNC